MRKRLQRLVAVLLTLVLCVGCGSEPQEQEAEEIEIVPTIFSDITGIPQDKTVMRDRGVRGAIFLLVLLCVQHS